MVGSPSIFEVVQEQPIIQIKTRIWTIILKVQGTTSLHGLYYRVVFGYKRGGGGVA